MRGAIAAACAAVLMGLAPTPALASLAASCRDRIESVASAQRSISLGIRAGLAVEPEASRTATRAPARELGRAVFASAQRTVWRAPAGAGPRRLRLSRTDGLAPPAGPGAEPRSARCLIALSASQLRRFRSPTL